MSRWPRDNMKELVAFYGNPDAPDFEKKNLVLVVPPFKITYAGKTTKGIRCHKKCAVALKAALDEIWDYYEHDQKKIDATGISDFSGSHNNRTIRGRKRKSTHAFGCGFDFDADALPMGSNKKLPKPIAAAFRKVGATLGENFKNRKDPMHIQFATVGVERVAEAIELEEKKPTTVASEIISYDPAMLNEAQLEPASDIDLAGNFTAPDYSMEVEGETAAEPHDDDQVKFVQQRLRDLGYFETGNVDGKLEDRTKGAISTFRGENRLPLSTDIDDQLLVALAKAKPRSIPDSRAKATEQEVAEKVEPVKQSMWNRFVAFLFGIPAAIAAFFNGIATYFRKTFEDLDQYRQWFYDVPGWVWFGAVAVIAFFIWWQSNKAVKSGTKLYQEGRVL